jgi:glyoxylase-like metal-dependent hydrolase (beta-lactamase superfamily II)
MILNKTGLVRDGLYVTGLSWSPTYLLDGEVPILFEAGFYCMAKFYERDIRNILKNRVPHMLFLSHVHYDHCGASSYFKKVFPDLTIVASKRASEIIKRPGAQKLMKKLSNNVIKIVSSMPEIDRELILLDPFEPFEVHMTPEDNTTINIGKVTIRVLATPGHTRDLFSYYLPQRKILFSTEACGTRDQMGHINTEFLVDYEMYMTSLKRLASLDIDILCPGHHFVFTDDDVKKYFLESIRNAEYFKNHVTELLYTYNKSVDKVVSIIKEEEYDINPGPKQPEEAYLLNLRTRITHLAEKM